MSVAAGRLIPVVAPLNTIPCPGALTYETGPIGVVLKFPTESFEFPLNFHQWISPAARLLVLGDELPEPPQPIRATESATTRANFDGVRLSTRGGYHPLHGGVPIQNDITGLRLAAPSRKPHRPESLIGIPNLPRPKVCE